MGELPTGTITMLFSDIEGSTMLLSGLGDQYGEALSAQRALAAHDWPGGVAVRVRMGLHSGEPARHEDGYIGLDVHRAARIAAAAHGGQVVLSEATRLLVEPRLPAGVSIRDLGFHRLKDIEAPERIYQLVAAGLPEQFPPLKSLGPPVATVGVTAGVHGFPAALTRFISSTPCRIHPPNIWRTSCETLRSFTDGGGGGR